MELIIDLDIIEDLSKKEYLLNTLKLLEIKFKATERPQTLVEFDFESVPVNSEMLRTKV